jgi:GDP-D-mannose dehydratase
LLVDPSKAKKILKWVPKVKIKGLVKEMVSHEMKKILND